MSDTPETDSKQFRVYAGGAHVQVVLKEDAQDLERRLREAEEGCSKMLAAERAAHAETKKKSWAYNRIAELEQRIRELEDRP